jgi:hypothetical protein
VWYYNNALGRPNKKKFIARDKSYDLILAPLNSFFSLVLQLSNVDANRVEFGNVEFIKFDYILLLCSFKLYYAFLKHVNIVSYKFGHLFCKDLQDMHLWLTIVSCLIL